VSSERLKILRDLHKLLETIGETDVGFYIGGMKELALKKSQECKIILGTYSMSSEGMDIPRLNTLFMCSPKSDIEQSVGRILRKEHEGVVARVYDIVDNFSVFSNQAQRRRKFYESKKYQIFTSQITAPESQSIAEQVKMALQLEAVKPKKRASKKLTSVCLITDD
jgi:superfamily II DNA or RNA helicase